MPKVSRSLSFSLSNLSISLLYFSIESISLLRFFQARLFLRYYSCPLPLLFLFQNLCRNKNTTRITTVDHPPCWPLIKLFFFFSFPLVFHRTSLTFNSSNDDVSKSLKIQILISSRFSFIYIYIFPFVHSSMNGKCISLSIRHHHYHHIIFIFSEILLYFVYFFFFF